MQVWFPRRLFVVGGVCLMTAVPELVSAEDVRIVTYNTQGDVSSPSPTSVAPVLSTVLEGIGQQKYAGDGILQLPDIIALQETTSNTTTVLPIVNDLNSFYGKNLYNYSSYQATTYQNSNSSGGGPNGLIYNQTTMTLLASVGVGTPEGATNGMFRQVVRYEFQPVADAGTNNGIFYIYDSHAKSGSASESDDGTTVGAMRQGEAQIVRNDEAANLPANAAVMYVGDWNMDGTTEAAYQTLTAANSPGGKTQGAGIDPDNPTNNYTQNWSSTSFVGIQSESDAKLEYRDDLQLMTSNIYNDAAGGLDYVQGSLHSFGNNGTTPEDGSTNQPGNTSLNDIVGNGSLTVSQVLGSLNASTGSDHLPVVADYTISTQANGIWLGGNGNWSNASLWSNGVVPDGTTIEVKIANGNSTASIVTLDQSESAQDVTVDAIDTLQIAAGQTLTLAGPGVSTFNGTFANAGTVSATGAIVNAGTFTSTGTFAAAGVFTNSGTVTLGGTQSWAAGSTFNNAAGKTTFLTDPGSATASPLAVVVSGGTVTFGSTVHLGSLNVAAGAKVSLPVSTTVKTVLVTAALSDSGTIDLGTGAMDVTAAGSLTAVTRLVASGYATGNWTGTGITSTAAASDTSHLTAVGVIQNNQSGSPLFTAAHPFEGVTPGAGDTLAMETWYGDANLDGVVDGSDYSLIDAGYASGGALTGWYNGDFNYDGVIDGSDYALMDNAFNNQTGNLSTAALVASEAGQTAGPVSAVPEPASGVALLFAAGLIRRTRRGQHKACKGVPSHISP